MVQPVHVNDFTHLLSVLNLSLVAEKQRGNKFQIDTQRRNYIPEEF